MYLLNLHLISRWDHGEANEEKINGKSFSVSNELTSENSTANKGFLYFLNEFVIECGLKLQILSTRWVGNRFKTATAVTLDSLSKFKITLAWQSSCNNSKFCNPDCYCNSLALFYKQLMTTTSAAEKKLFGFDFFPPPDEYLFVQDSELLLEDLSNALAFQPVTRHDCVCV